MRQARVARRCAPRRAAESPHAGRAWGRIAGALAVGFAAGALGVVAACSGEALPHPTFVSQPTSALVEVPFPPPPGRPEVIPAEPKLTALPSGYDGGWGDVPPDPVWIDGGWQWSGQHWSWKRGRWVAMPKGIVYAPWTTVRRADGVLFFAPGAFRDARGNQVDDPPALAVALATPGADAAIPERGGRRDGGRGAFEAGALLELPSAWHVADGGPPTDGAPGEHVEDAEAVR